MTQGSESAIKLEFGESGLLIDFLTGNELVDLPEERVRQQYLRILHYQYGYPKGVLARQVPIYHGNQQARDADGAPIFADIAVYDSEDACRRQDQGAIRLVVENKKPDEQSGHNQLVSYIFNTSANGAVWHNGKSTKWFRRYSVPEQKLSLWPGIPRHREAWDAVGRRTKAALKPLIDVRGTFERCHNKLYRRGSEGEDLTMDMVRILLAKARDEELEEPNPRFYCTPEEYATEEGRADVALRVKGLFTEVRDANPTVFDPTETIRVGDREIAEVVVELQDYAIIGDDDHQWDVMGAAYEQYTADVLKREGGEFFTNRLVVALLTKMVDPGPDDLLLDPAGGTGGFCTAGLRHMRKAVRGLAVSDAAKRRRMDRLKDKIFYIDIKHRLVKIAKAAMILTGNGHRGFTQGDSLAPPDDLPPAILNQCRPGTIDRVLTNPPFAGTADGRIDSPAEMMPQFQLAHRWEWTKGGYVPTGDPVAGGVPPELLFIERCVQWLRPGGIMGIVVPKGVLENPDATLATRHFILRYTRVLAVIACHKDTFQKFTGTRTALLVLQKRDDADIGADDDYPIFMAVSRKIGQDSEGRPVFVKDDAGKDTDKLDHDLDDIYDDWIAARNGALTPSEYRFTVQRSELNPKLVIISPQSFLPSLNEAIAQVVRLDDSPDFDVVPLGEIASRVFKGTRFKREDLETESELGDDVVRYYTPAALLQGRGESLKLLNLARASTRRRKEIEKHVLTRLDLLVTRSGSVGRVILVSSDQAGHVGSDDLIRIEIEDANLRLYVYAFLKGQLGYKQMMKNEYGTIQQHLEPAHLREVLIPIPTDPAKTAEVAARVLAALEAKERSIAEEDLGQSLLAELTAVRPDAGLVVEPEQPQA